MAAVMILQQPIRMNHIAPSQEYDEEKIIFARFIGKKNQNDKRRVV
ncbi:MAG: hypothetical protein V1887_01250 [Candidatus Aenigmatarchaeota archaeon]